MPLGNSARHYDLPEQRLPSAEDLPVSRIDEMGRHGGFKPVISRWCNVAINRRRGRFDDDKRRLVTNRGKG